MITTGHIIRKINHTHSDAIEYNLGKVMGGVAFARGIFALCNDPEAMAHLEGRAVGTSTMFLKGWNVGNTQARLAA